MEYEVKVIDRPNAVIKVHRPILTNEERERRMAGIRKAAEKFLKAVEYEGKRLCR